MSIKVRVDVLHGSSPFRLAVGAVLTVAIALSSLAAGSIHHPRPAKGRHVISTSSPAVSTHERFATFLSGDGFTSVLLLENFRQDMPITVTPSLILDEGEVPMNPVFLAAHSAETVDLTSFLAANGFADRHGTVSVRYDFNSYGPISAVVQSSDSKHYIYLNSVAQSHEEFWKGTAFDAVLWAPDTDTQGYITITNSSTAPHTARVTFLVKGHSEELPPIEVPPRRTEMLPIDGLVARSHDAAAGVHIEYDEYAGDILVEGQLFNKRTGFAKNIHFVDKALKYPTSTLRTHFLLLGPQSADDGFPGGMSFRSVAALRNLDSAPVQVTPTIRFSNGGSVQTITLPPIALAVGESRLLNLTAEQNAGRIPADLHQASLELIPDDNQSRIVGELFNFSASTGGYVVGPSFSSYPTRGTASIWRTDGSFQTTVIIENTASQDDKVTLKVFSEAGSYSKTFPISAGGLLKINVKQLQQAAVPDDNGHLLAGDNGVLAIAGGHNGLSKLSFDKIVHSGDEADYVGLPPNPCDFVTGISMFLDLSGGENPFPLMTTWDWSQAGSVDQASSGASASPSSLVQLSNVNGADMATISFGPGSEGQTLDFSGPTLTATDCEACSAGDFFPQTTTQVPPFAQISNVTVSPSTIGTTSSPTSATITVSVFHQAMTGITSPQVTVEVGTATTTPTGITVTYNNQTSEPISLSGASPATAQFTVSSPSGAGSITIQASLSKPTPVNAFSIVQPNPASNGQATLITTQGVPLQFTTGASLPSVAVGSHYSTSISVTGGQKPYAWTAITSPPPGLTLNTTTGAITGAPTTLGDFTFTVNVTDSSTQKQTITSNFTIQVVQ